MSLLRKLKSKRKRVKNLKISAEAIFQKTLNHYFKKSLLTDKKFKELLILE
jgi:hypothetical protein